MKTLRNITLIVALSVALSGCLATVATIGASLATGLAAGCHDAQGKRSTNVEALKSICGSAFD